MFNFIYKNEGKILFSLGVLFILLVLFLFGQLAKKQGQEKTVFMAECLQENKQYQCDVLWSQTDASKQVRDAAIGFAAGAAIGASANRR